MIQILKKTTVDMTVISLQRSLESKLFCATKLVQTLNYHITPFSSTKFGHKTQTTSKNKALKILHIITPKPKPATIPNYRHLRLIEDFLQTGSDQVSDQSLISDLNATSTLNSNKVIEYVRKIEPMFVDTEDSSSLCSSVDARVLSTAVSFCGLKRDLRSGIQYHCLAIRNGFIDNVYVGSSLISFYSKCDRLGDSYKVFDQMPVRNVVSWTAIISGFAQEWHVDFCLWLYSDMRVSGLKPNDFTFTSLLSGCTGSGALGQGRSAHCQIIRMGFDSYMLIANALISMYCKCGSVESALLIYNNMVDKDIVSQNSMIAGFAQHGMAAQAIELFEKMKQQVRPDAITFLGVLSSCRHAGLVDHGRKYFNLMTEYGVKPELDHYSCLIDLLGRAKLLDKARDLIERMPMPPNAVIWGSLLSSCRLHASVRIGIEAAENRLLLEPNCAATHVQLVNLYASARRWDQAARVRKLMKDRGLKTSPGYSWIEIKNEVHRFRVEDMSSNRLTEVSKVLHCLIEHMMAFQHATMIPEDLLLIVNT